MWISQETILSNRHLLTISNLACARDGVRKRNARIIGSARFTVSQHNKGMMAKGSKAAKNTHGRKHDPRVGLHGLHCSVPSTRPLAATTARRSTGTLWSRSPLKVRSNTEFRGVLRIYNPMFHMGATTCALPTSPLVGTTVSSSVFGRCCIEQDPSTRRDGKRVPG